VEAFSISAGDTDALAVEALSISVEDTDARAIFSLCKRGEAKVGIFVSKIHVVNLSISSLKIDRCRALDKQEPLQDDEID
jgi:hypothetical protein